MKRKPYSVPASKLRQTFLQMREELEVPMLSIFDSQVITSIRVSYPHGRTRIVINGHGTDDTRTSLTVLTD